MDEIMEAIFARLIDHDDAKAADLERAAGIVDMDALDERTVVITTQASTFTLTLQEVK